MLTGLRFESLSWRDGLMGFLPARAFSANWLFRLRSSNSVGCRCATSVSLPAGIAGIHIDRPWQMRGSKGMWVKERLSVCVRGVYPQLRRVYMAYGRV